MELKSLTIDEKDKYTIKDFVSSCSDNSIEECNISFKDDKMASITKAGTHDITIVAKDSSNNTVEKTTKLVINKKKPVITITPSKDTPTSNNNQTNNNQNNNVNNNQNNNNITNNNQPSQNNNKPAQNTPSQNNPTQNVPKEEVSYKYGTKITKVTNTNGSVSYKYDFSTFNATTADMKAEASTLISTNANSYNEVLKFTNVYRTEVGAAPLALDNNLSIAATIRAIEMAYKDKFDHTRPNNTSCFSIFKELGISGYFTYGENIAYGSNYRYYSPEHVTTGWRNSPGHYANMINNDFTKLGVGYYKLGNKEYYVQMFGG